MPPATTRAEHSAGDSSLLDLRRTDCPARPVRGLLGRLLPDPLHEAGWRRFVHADLAGLTAAQRRREAVALTLAVALLPETAAVPPWVVDRLRRLHVRPRGRAA